jgi:hypothetical protein
MSVSRVQGPNLPEQNPASAVNLKPLVIKFRDQMMHVKDCHNPQFVADVANTIKTLYESSVGVGNKSSELINNLHAMLNAPISLEEGDDISLYQAAITVPHEALTEILKMHVKLTASTELFINELNVLASDL